MIYDVVLTDKALHQIDQAVAWYESQDRNVAAAWYNGFIDALISLESNPQQHSIARESDEFPVQLRQLLYGSGRLKTHRALFVIHQDRVVVHAVRHLAQADVTPDEL